MKKIVIIIFFAIGFSSLSQEKKVDKSNFLISYKLNFKKFANSEVAKSENTILIVNNQGSLFTFEAMMNLDSIKKVRVLTSDDALLYRPSYYYLIKRSGNIISHYETIGNDLLKFDETSTPNWKLIDKDTLIYGYKCKKALLNYGGRDWIGWYTTEIPTPVGPYKFHGLPGLIINIKDTEDTYEFTATEIKSGNFPFDQKLNNYFITEEGEKFTDIDKKDFYLVRKNFYQLSLNERLQYMNRENEGTYSFIIESADGAVPRTNLQTKTRNFIERNK